MDKFAIKNIIHKSAAFLAVAFGILTLFVGSRTLLGFSDPGYTIFYPLLLFNTIMGLFYMAAGILIWIDHKSQIKVTRLIFGANLIMLLLMLLLYLFDTEIAKESFKAMTFRTAFWLAIYLILRTYLKK